MMIASEWGTPNMWKDGVNPELLLAKNTAQDSCLGPDKRAICRKWTCAEQQWARAAPSHDPNKTYGFVSGRFAQGPSSSI
jgi:selenium-binding protein 1